MKVVIASFRAHDEASRAQEALADAGIAADVSGRRTDLERISPDVVANGFDLAVDGGESQRAIAIIEELWPPDPPQARPPLLCPACGSRDIRRLRRFRIGAAMTIGLLVVGIWAGQRDLFLLVAGVVIALLIFTPPLRCRNCGEGWSAPPAVAPELDRGGEEIACPRCGSTDTERLTHRRQKAATLIVNLVVPPTFLVWPFLARRRCSTCGHEWR